MNKKVVTVIESVAIVSFAIVAVVYGQVLLDQYRQTEPDFVWNIGAEPARDTHVGEIDVADSEQVRMLDSVSSHTESVGVTVTPNDSKDIMRSLSSGN